jgi:hypothetical protein
VGFGFKDQTTPLDVTEEPPSEWIISFISKKVDPNTLTFTGRLLDKLLDIIDKNHSIKAIEEDEK